MSSLLIAAPDSTTRMRQAADLVVDPTVSDPAIQINTKTLGARGKVEFCAGTYSLRSGVIRRTGLVYGGEGEDTCVEAAVGFTGTSLFVTETGAHYTTVRDMRLEGRKRVANAVYCDSGKPDAKDPLISPDCWHIHENLVVLGTAGPAFASTSGTDGTREGYFKNILILGGGFNWSGSDTFIDNVELRNSPTPFTISGGSCRIGALKVFYSNAVGVRISSSRCMAAMIEVQDAGSNGIEIAGADCTIGVLKVDSCGRLMAGDAVIVQAARAHLPCVNVIDRGANSLRVRHGVVLQSASGAVISAMVGPGITGSAWTGTTTGVSALRVNGKTVVGEAAPSAPTADVDLGPLTQRVADVEAAVALAASAAETANQAATTAAQSAKAATDTAGSALAGATQALQAHDGLVDRLRGAVN